MISLWIGGDNEFSTLPAFPCEAESCLQVDKCGQKVQFGTPPYNRMPGSSWGTRNAGGQRKSLRRIFKRIGAR
jgi:hypothetical protein